MQENGTTGDSGKLTELTAEKQREVMHRLAGAKRHDGPRSKLPDTPDDPVAYKLLDAAGDAIGKGQLRQGIAILKLVADQFAAARKRPVPAWLSTGSPQRRANAGDEAATPLIIAAWLGTAASLAASALAVSTGSVWLASLAVLLVGTASLVPDVLAYRQTRKMLPKHAVPPARPQAAAWPVSEQAIKLPQSLAMLFCMG